MSFKEATQRLSMQIMDRRNHITNEETTKHSLIIPFIHLLGFDVFNPLEVKPEYVADFGKKKGEKVDYAIFKDNHPVIFIEAKSVNELLDNHDAQLSRYFNSTPEIKIGIITNGVRYKFFTDLSQHNVMDSNPFFEFDITDVKGSDIETLSQFRKDVFDSVVLVKLAEELVYMATINRTLRELFKNPSDEFIRFLVKDVSGTRITSNVLERFRPIVKKCIQVSLVEIISQGILSESKPVTETAVTETEPPSAAQITSDGDNSDASKKLVTTVEELALYNAIVNILKKYGKDTSQLNYRDTINYFGIQKRNSAGWFLRFSIDSSFKFITSKLSVNIAKQYATGFDVIQAPKGMGESRILLQSDKDVEKLHDFIVKSFEIVENF